MTQSTIERRNLVRPVPNVPKMAQPFYYKNGQRAVFFIHGFSDSLCRVNGFAKYLAKHGITTRGVLLPGHGRTWQELSATSPNDWYREVEKGILELAGTVKDIYVVGISFGGNLALKFESEHPGILKGIVALEAPMNLQRQWLIRHVAIPFYEKIGWKYWTKKFLYRLDSPEKDTVFKQGVLDKMPVVNIKQIVKFLEDGQKFLKKVKCDLLVIQSKKSNLITRDSAEKLLAAVSSKRKDVMWIDSIYHAFITEAQKRQVFNSALDFFDIKIN